jgi:hypothetical protein
MTLPFRVTGTRTIRLTNGGTETLHVLSYWPIERWSNPQDKTLGQPTRRPDPKPEGQSSTETPDGQRASIAKPPAPAR